MSAAPKSQLELYLEQVDADYDNRVDTAVEGVTTGSEVLLKDPQTKSGPFEHLVSRLLDIAHSGMLEDCLEISRVVCIHWYDASPSLVGAMAREDVQPTKQLFRRLGSCLLLATLFYAGAFTPRGSTTRWFIYWCALVLFVLLVVVPVVLGAVHCALGVHLQRQRTAARAVSLQLLSVIKRIQLVSMGGTISQPMPPVTKLESKHLLSCDRSGSERNVTAVLGAKEMRRLLGRSLSCTIRGLLHANALLRSCEDAEVEAELKHRCAALERSLSLHQVPSLATLEETVGAAVRDSHYSTDLRIPRKGKETDPSSRSSTSSDTNKDKEPGTEISPWQSAQTLLTSMWGSYQLRCVYAKHVRACCCIGGPLVAIPTPLSGTSLEIPNRGSDDRRDDTSAPARGKNSYSDLYLTIRKDLARLRGSYEQVVLQLYLAEQQLSQADALFYILPDSAQLAQLDAANTGAAAAAASERRVQALLRAVSALGGAGLSSSEDALCYSRLPELCALAGADLASLVTALPSVGEYDSLLGNITELAQATMSRASPAQRRADAKQHVGGAGSSANLLEQDVTQPHRGIPTTGFVQSPQQYGDDAPGKEETAVSGALALSAHAGSSSNVIDVYTTTVPRHSRAKAGKMKLTPQEHADQEAAARERASARTLLRELNQHLRLMRTSQVRGDGSGGEGSDGEKVASAAAGLATARVLMERVRELVAVGLDDDEDNGTAGVQMTTTISVVTDVEDSDLTVPSLECEGQVSARAGTKVAPLVQVGTLMLTEDELHRTSDGHNAEQASQQQAMRAAFMSEVAQAQQGDGGVLSAFAAALHARRVETTFGDGVGDSD